jgi:hypothetical protein
MYYAVPGETPESMFFSGRNPIMRSPIFLGWPSEFPSMLPQGPKFGLRLLLLSHTATSPFPDPDSSVARCDKGPVARESQRRDKAQAVAVRVEFGDLLARGGIPEPHDRVRSFRRRRVFLTRYRQDSAVGRKRQAVRPARRPFEGEPLLARRQVPQFHLWILAAVSRRKGFPVRRERDRGNPERVLAESRKLLSCLHVPDYGGVIAVVGRGQPFAIAGKGNGPTIAVNDNGRNGFLELA